VQRLLPDYMTMGQDGMGDMGEMGMKVPANSIPMVGGAGPYDYITMGGMFTILKVREQLPNGYDQDPGWYEPPAGTLAALAPADVLARNGVAADGSSAPKPPPGVNAAPPQAAPTQGHAPGAHRSGHDGHGGGPVGGHVVPPARGQTTTGATTAASLYVCPMHPEVVSANPNDRCPKCQMKLRSKR
jgi:hypothetical protein